MLVPDDITLQTEDQNGASATFNPQAIDNIDELITPTCSPASGSEDWAMAQLKLFVLQLILLVTHQPSNTFNVMNRIYRKFDSSIMG